MTVTGALLTLDCSYFGSAQGSQVILKGKGWVFKKRFLGTSYYHSQSSFYISVVKKIFVIVTGALLTLDCSYFGSAQGSQVE